MSDENLNVNEESNQVHESSPSKGLPSGESHCFDTGYATTYGVDEAIMIKNLQFFIKANRNRNNNFHDGRYWTYDTAEDFVKHFPYWTAKQIRRIIGSLLGQGVIIKGCFNKDWSNRTSWYAFKDEDKFLGKIPIKKKEPKKVEPENEVLQPTDNQDVDDFTESGNPILPSREISSPEVGSCIYSTSTITSTISSSSSLKVPNPEVSKSAEADEVDLNKSSESKPKAKRIPSTFSPKIREVGQQIINFILDSKPTYVTPKVLNSFLTEVDFLLRLDKRDPQRVYDVLNWALSDSFWRDKMFKPNPAKYLREKFDQLEAKMEAKPAKKDRKFAPSSEGKYKESALYKQWVEEAL